MFENLTNVEIPPNSNLQTIQSKTKDILIPLKVSKICERVFYFCLNLTKVEFSQNLNLQLIEKQGFSYSKIKNIFIPPKVSEIYEYSFSNCLNLQIIEISDESSNN